MKKFMNLLRAWRRGEEIEIGIAVPVSIVILAAAIILYLIFKP